MTYCVGLRLERGLVFMSDTRTNAGVDDFSTVTKLHSWEVPGERSIVLMTAGNLATTQALVSLLNERTLAPDDRDISLMSVPTMFQAARLIGRMLREVIAENSNTGPSQSDTFNATLILGGQIVGMPPRLFMIYPEGNFIEAQDDTPFFQIGETKYGRPILVRAQGREYELRGGSAPAAGVLRQHNQSQSLGWTAARCLHAGDRCDADYRPSAHPPRRPLFSRHFEKVGRGSWQSS